jgi:hypothetical protein
VIITITSPAHGVRTFQRIGFRPYVRKDGTETGLAIWQGTCVVCGEPFEVTTPAAAVRVEHSKAFGATRCPQHRRQRKNKLSPRGK